ncbi:hypothetical protein P368_12530 [Comamonas thiooxydans]|nr:hypothetical protein P369_04055 [Comamonas thiooxydans]KGH01920.1 hypothetical protein P367_03460 [Comamonas thiooxydans]KGH03252.1 hypothetical protein P365_16680 [Comamonas thiooxydans]KGH11940.1 hypothetical protein P368_12530 [Comamonas thiooxydans]
MRSWRRIHNARRAGGCSALSLGPLSSQITLQQSRLSMAFQHCL